MMIRGHKFRDVQDMTQHFRSLIDNPWVHGCPLVLDKAQRRGARAIAPPMPENCLIYNVDGASRSGTHERQASCGAVLVVNGNVLARFGKHLGDETNNYAEYNWVILFWSTCSS